LNVEESIYAQATDTGMRIATESTASHYLPSNQETNGHPADVPARGADAG
jgi:hypothetical protein